MTSSAGPEQTADLSKERLLFVLPSDIANSLQYLDDVDLHRLKSAVEAEIARRKPGASTGKADEVFVPTAARPVSSPREAAKIAEIPEGKANLVRASFEAGVKPPTIARTFGISISVVTYYSLDEKRKRAIDHLWSWRHPTRSRNFCFAARITETASFPAQTAL